MITLYLICFTLGLSLTVLSALGVFTHLHFGHVHFHVGHTHVPHVQGGMKSSVSPVNGFTLAAFLCWFGGCGYLLAKSGDFGWPWCWRSQRSQVWREEPFSFGSW
jgi:hypothetical protein